MAGLQTSVWLTAEALSTQRKEFLIKKYSELGELSVSVVNIPS
jgi:hypothetical protein